MRLTGFPQDALIGHSLHELHLYARWDGSPYHFIETGIYQTLKQGVAKQSDSDVFWRHAGDHFAVSWTCTPIKRGGEVQGAVLAFRDVTQRKRQEHAAARGPGRGRDPARPAAGRERLPAGRGQERGALRQHRRREHRR